MDKILILDNYDSFTYNLYHLVQSLYSGNVEVKRDVDLPHNLGDYSGFIISPGPGRPSSTPKAMEIIKRYSDCKPFLGVCLGMQCLNEHFGGVTVTAPYPIHGKTTSITHNESTLFKNIPQQSQVARYHSLMISQGDNIRVTSRNSEGIIMGIEHRYLPLYGVQFHPESFLTEHGEVIIENFLKEVTGV